MKDILDMKYARNIKDLDAIIDLYEKDETNETFGGFRPDRLMGSSYHFLITLNNKNIGFILLVKEKQNKQVLFLDIAISKKFRNKGYGKQALVLFKEKYINQIKDVIIAETKKENISINKIMDNMGFELIESSDKTINKYKIKNLTNN